MPAFAVERLGAVDAGLRRRPGRARGTWRTPCAWRGRGSRPASAAPSSPRPRCRCTIAAAPSDDGHDSRKCSGSQSIGDSLTVSMSMSGMPQVGVRVLQRVLPVLHRHLPADVLGRARAADVAADPRGERAARALAAGLAARERPGGVALGLLLVADDQDPLVATRTATSVAPEMAVDAPTEPAVCTRWMGLPTAPSASASDSSGIITPSRASGALPITMASMSAKVRSASSSASSAAHGRGRRG